MSQQTSDKSFAWVFPVILVLSVIVVGVGLALALNRGAWSVLAAGCASVVAVLICWALSAQLHVFHAASLDQANQALTSINERFEQFSVMLNLISEQQLLSDRAKAVAFREKDSDVLRRAIQDEILKQNWEGATSLVSEMEQAFGYRQEADRLRAEIEDRRKDLVRKQINDGIAVIDRHIRAESWTEAVQEAQRVASHFPHNAQAIGLPLEVEKRREAHKKQLIDSWNEAVARHDVDGSIEILKRLDMYLTPTEAESYQETARSVFKEKLNTLRTQFSVAVQDHKWSEALRLADNITADFPNTQMAKEVRDMMDSLRARASGLQPAAVV